MLFVWVILVLFEEGSYCFGGDGYIGGYVVGEFLECDDLVFGFFYNIQIQIGLFYDVFICWNCFYFLFDNVGKMMVFVEIGFGQCGGNLQLLCFFFIVLVIQIYCIQLLLQCQGDCCLQFVWEWCCLLVSRCWGYVFIVVFDYDV